MHLRKVLFIVASCKGCSTEVSLGRKKHFQKTLPPFMWDRLSASKLGETVHRSPEQPWQLVFEVMFIKVSALGKCEFTTLPPIRFFCLSPLPRNTASTVWFFFCGFWFFFLRVEVPYIARKTFVTELQVHAFCFTNDRRLKCKWGCWYLSSLRSLGKTLDFLL